MTPTENYSVVYIVDFLSHKRKARASSSYRTCRTYGTALDTALWQELHNAYLLRGHFQVLHIYTIKLLYKANIRAKLSSSAVIQWIRGRAKKANLHISTGLLIHGPVCTLVAPSRSCFPWEQARAFLSDRNIEPNHALLTSQFVPAKYVWVYSNKLLVKFTHHLFYLYLYIYTSPLRSASSPPVVA